MVPASLRKAIGALQHRVACRLGRELHWWELNRLERLYWEYDHIQGRAESLKYGSRVRAARLDTGEPYLTTEAA